MSGRHESDPEPWRDRIRDSLPGIRPIKPDDTAERLAAQDTYLFGELDPDHPRTSPPAEETRRRTWPIPVLVGTLLVAAVGLPVGLSAFTSDTGDGQPRRSVTVSHSASPSPSPETSPRPKSRPTATKTVTVRVTTRVPTSGPTVFRTLPAPAPIRFTLTPKPAPTVTKTITKTVTKQVRVCFELDHEDDLQEISCP